jgi:hypothetical protein
MIRVLAILMGIIQFSFAFHAVKTGKGAMWVTIIIVQNARRSALETEQEWVKLARRGLETGAA